MENKKLPKIDIKKVRKKDLHRIYSTEIFVNDVHDSSKQNIIAHHSINIDGKDYVLGESQLLVHHDRGQISWLKFYPTNHVKYHSEILSTNMNKEDLDYNKNIYTQICRDNPEIMDNYDIIDKTIERRIEPLALIRNHFKRGLGTLAHHNLLEQMLANYDKGIEAYDISHSIVSPYRKKQLSKMEIMEFAEDAKFYKGLGIDIRETVADYYVKSKRYLENKGIL